ncbi:uncharacterized protein GJ701_004898 [Geothlypis trichas]
MLCRTYGVAHSPRVRREPLGAAAPGKGRRESRAALAWGRHGLEGHRAGSAPGWGAALAPRSVSARGRPAGSRPLTRRLRARPGERPRSRTRQRPVPAAIPGPKLIGPDPDAVSIRPTRERRHRPGPLGRPRQDPNAPSRFRLWAPSPACGQPRPGIVAGAGIKSRLGFAQSSSQSQSQSGRYRNSLRRGRGSRAPRASTGRTRSHSPVPSRGPAAALRAPSDPRLGLTQRRAKVPGQRYGRAGPQSAGTGCCSGAATAAGGADAESCWRRPRSRAVLPLPRREDGGGIGPRIGFGPGMAAGTGRCRVRDRGRSPACGAGTPQGALWRTRSAVRARRPRVAAGQRCGGRGLKGQGAGPGGTRGGTRAQVCRAGPAQVCGASERLRGAGPR